MDSQEEIFREKLHNIACRLKYKRLARASKEDGLSWIVSEIITYKKRDEIIKGLFKDSFLGRCFVKSMSKYDDNSIFLENLLYAAGELMRSTEDEDAHKSIAYVAEEYREIFAIAMQCTAHIAHYSRNTETINETLRFMNSYLRTFRIMMKNLCAFNFCDSEGISVAGDFGGKYYSSREELADDINQVLELYKDALDNLGKKAHGPKYMKTNSEDTPDISGKKPWYSRMALFFGFGKNESDEMGLQEALNNLRGDAK